MAWLQGELRIDAALVGLIRMVQRKKKPLDAAC